jgi:NitT/TauT family transport system ATP-binding protein
MTTAARLTLEHVGKRFAGTTGAATVAVQDFTLDIAQGEFLVIVGPSGCGKTTVLNMLAGLEQASEGVVAIDGRAIEGPGPDRGVMFQDYALFPWHTVQGNVEFGLRYGPAGDGLDRAARDARVHDTLELVGLSGAAEKYPHQLSGGMRQRVALARLIANEPQVLLMDEPLAALDAQTRIILQGELLRIWGQDRPASQRRTVVFITHAIDEAVFLADRVLVFARRPGRLHASVEIKLPRPRALEIKRRPEFVDYVDRIWKMIEDDVRTAVIHEHV